MKSLCAVLVLLVSMSSFGKYVGRLGPIYDDGYEKVEYFSSGCQEAGKSLLLVATANGPYSIPRVKIKSATVKFKSGLVKEYSDSQIQTHKEFLIKNDGSDDCVDSISLIVKAAGINPGRQNIVYLDIWSTQQDSH